MVDQLVKSFKGISALGGLEVLNEENLLELFDGPVEDGHCDLVGLDIVR